MTVTGSSGVGGSLLTITGTLNKFSNNSLSVRSFNSTTNPFSMAVNELNISGVGNSIFGTGATTGLASFTATTARLSGASNVRWYFGRVTSGTINIQNLTVDGGQFSIYGGGSVSGTQTLAVNGLSGTGGAISTSNDAVTSNTAFGILSIQSTGSTNFSGEINDTGTLGAGTTAVLALTKGGTGTQVLSGSNNYTGGTTITDGVLQLGNNSASGSIAGNVNTGSTSAVLAFSRSNAYAFTGTISGSGQVRQIGSGTTTLSAGNSYSGGTTITAGRLVVGNASALGSTSGAVTVNGGTLDLGNFNVTTGTATFAGGTITTGTLTSSAYAGRSGTVSAVLTGSGALTKTTSGTLTLSGANTFTGSTTVSAGTLRASAANALGATTAITVETGGLLQLSTSNAINDSAAVTLSGGSILRDSGVSETMGALTLTANSTLDFGSGATGSLVFGTYTPAFRLDVTNFVFGDTLVFASDLTSTFAGNYSNFFTFGGQAITTGWSGSQFTIAAVPEPSTVVAGALMLGVLAWPLRKKFRPSRSA